eukprot:gene10020-6997_t
MSSPARPRHYDVAESTVIHEEDIARKTAVVASHIAAAYRGVVSDTNPLVLVCVLKGSIIFTADLIRHLMDHGIQTVMEFVYCTSYYGGTASSGDVQMQQDVRQSLKDKHVLIVEDIVDSAVTLSLLVKLFSSRGAASVKTVVLLDKPEGRKTPFQPDFTVQTIPACFVLGYGLDFDEKYRGVRDVVVMKPSYYEKPKKSKL